MDSVKITTKAVSEIIKIMRKNGLHIEKYAFSLGIDKEALTMTFTDQIDGSRVEGDLFVQIDPRIEEFHKNKPITIDFVTHGKKQGLIFLER